MKILFINRSDRGGGAASALFNLSNAMYKYFKTKNYLLVQVRRLNDDNIIEILSSKFEKIIELLLNKLENILGIQYVFLPFSYKKIIYNVKKIKPDVIHIHNIHGGYFQINLLTELSKIAPIYWTLHDMWSFTNNAAHTFGDISWQYLHSGKKENKIYPQILLNFNNFLIKNKKYIYKNSNITLIAPSKWLYRMACKSPLFLNKKIVQINNCVDLRIFHPFSQKIKNRIRKKLNIPIGSKVLIFGADSFNNQWKNPELILEIINKLDKVLEENIYLIIFGAGKIIDIKNKHHIIIKKVGYIKSNKEMANYYNASDLLLYTSKADNLPYSLIESISCGVPAVTYDIGGCKEIVINNINGYVIEPFNSDLYFHKVNMLLRSGSKLKVFSNNCYKYAIKNYSSKNISGKYYQLFSKQL